MSDDFTSGDFEGKPYVAVPAGKCKTCDEILSSVFSEHESRGADIINKWLKHLNEEHKKPK